MYWISHSTILMISMLAYQICAGQGLDVSIYEEQHPEGKIIIKGDNREQFAVSIELQLDLKGMTSDLNNTGMIVLSPNLLNQKLVELTPIPGKSWSYKSNFKTYFGNVNTTEYDTNFVYELPFAPKVREFVSQGYFGRQSHQNEYALDFDLKVNSPVHASRGGRVVKVVDHHNKSCPDASCSEFNNFIVIEHEDGTYADYAHLQKGGAVVRPGQQISQGDLIGYSGNTGWTTGPHLHFSVFIPSASKRQTIPTLFRTGSNQIEQLQQGKHYRRPE